MTPDILIVRDASGYRLLHGHLHLSNALNMARELFIHVQGFGMAKVEKKDGRIVVNSEVLRSSMMPHL